MLSSMQLLLLALGLMPVAVRSQECMQFGAFPIGTTPPFPYADEDLVTFSPTQASEIDTAFTMARNANVNLCATWNQALSNSVDTHTKIANGEFSILLILLEKRKYADWPLDLRLVVAQALADANNPLKRIMVIDHTDCIAFYSPNGYNFPGIPAGAGIDNCLRVKKWGWPRSILEVAAYDDTVPPSTGPAGDAGSWGPELPGCATNKGGFFLDVVQTLPQYEGHFQRLGDAPAGPTTKRVTSFEYCYAELARVHYSTIAALDDGPITSGCDAEAKDAMRKQFQNGLVKLASSPACNAPPSCPVATTTAFVLKQDHFMPVSVDSYPSDPEGQLQQIQILSCSSSEPHNDANHGPDCVLDTNSQVLVRATRDGIDAGRMYRIEYTAKDNTDQTCTGHVYVCIPFEDLYDPDADSDSDDDDDEDSDDDDLDADDTPPCPDVDEIVWHEQFDLGSGCTRRSLALVSSEATEGALASSMIGVGIVLAAAVMVVSARQRRQSGYNTHEAAPLTALPVAESTLCRA